MGPRGWPGWGSASSRQRGYFVVYWGAAGGTGDSGSQAVGAVSCEKCAGVGGPLPAWGGEHMTVDARRYSRRRPVRESGDRTATRIIFREEGGAHTGTGRRGRRWRITSCYAGWRLEFRDPGDQADTYAGTHGTLEAAMVEAGR
jgi:hypothetical protein